MDTCFWQFTAKGLPFPSTRLAFAYISEKD
jgi:hypothetical protein